MRQNPFFSKIGVKLCSPHNLKKSKLYTTTFYFITLRLIIGFAESLAVQLCPRKFAEFLLILYKIETVLRYESLFHKKSAQR